MENTLNTSRFSTTNLPATPKTLRPVSSPSLQENQPVIETGEPQGKEFSTVRETRLSHRKTGSNAENSLSLTGFQSGMAGRITGGSEKPPENNETAPVREEGAAGIDTTKINRDGKTIEVGAFNTEWLGSDKIRPRTDEDYEKLAGIIKKSGAEVMSLEEVSDEKALGRVLKHLPNYDYVIGKSGTYQDGQNQRVAFIYNKDKVECDKSSVTEIEEAKAGYDTLRAPLSAKFKSKDGGFDFTLVGVHLKARMDEKSMKKREAQADALSGWIKNKTAAEPDKDIIVVGDYNDFIDSNTVKKLGAGDSLQMTTAEPASRGEFSHHGEYQSLIDHIGVTKGKGAAEEYIPNTTYVVPGDSNSDHSPVVSSFTTQDND